MTTILSMKAKLWIVVLASAAVLVGFVGFSGEASAKPASNPEGAPKNGNGQCVWACTGGGGDLGQGNQGCICCGVSMEPGSPNGIGADLKTRDAGHVNDEERLTPLLADLVRSQESCKQALNRQIDSCYASGKRKAPNWPD